MYILLVEYTQQGIEHVADSADRFDSARELLEDLGGEHHGMFLTFGQYDQVHIMEFPDDETAARFILEESSKGWVSTETLKAFPEDDYRDIIQSVAG